MVWTLAVNSVTVKPPGAADRASAADSAARIRGLFTSTPPTRVAPIWLGAGSWSRSPSPMNVTFDVVQGGGEPVDHAGEPADDLGEAVQDTPAAQRFGVVDDRFEAQHVLAFGVGLQRQVRRSGP